MFTKDPAELPITFLPSREDQGRGLSSECDHAGALILDFPASRTVKNKCLLFISYPACGILLQQPKQAKTRGNLQFRNEKWDITTNLMEIKIYYKGIL